MRYLRWKRNYLSGFPALDQPKQALYENLQALQTEMEQKEHCQDMTDLMQELSAQARLLFEAKAGSRQQAEARLDGHTTAIGSTLNRHLPLAALDTPACRECAICAHADGLMRVWLEQSITTDSDGQEVAA